jgi:hypothetical protein
MDQMVTRVSPIFLPPDTMHVNVCIHRYVSEQDVGVLFRKKNRIGMVARRTADMHVG